MPGKHPQLYSRQQIVDCVDEALERRGVPPRAAPIFVLVGPRGSGGASLLEHLMRRYDGQRYNKRAPGVNLDATHVTSVADLLAGAMQGLSDKIPFVRDIGFHLLPVALKALAFADGGGRPSFDSYMEASPTAALAEDFIADMTARLTPILQLPEQQMVAGAIRSLAPVVLRAVTRRRHAAQLAWFAEHVPPRTFHDGMDALWKLFEWHTDNDPDADRDLARVLCAAFLDDLRADYNDAGRRHAPRARNPYLLLHNAHLPLATMFLEMVEENRWDAEYYEKAADPLVVVAASVGRSPHGGTPIAATDPRLPSVVGTTPDHGGWWLPVRLTDLTHADVLAMTRSQVLHARRCDASFVFDLAGGHPAATSMIGRALASGELPAGEAGRVLECPAPRVPDRRPSTVEQELLARLIVPDIRVLSVDGSMSDILDRLAVCAATPGMRPAACTAAFAFQEWDRTEATRIREWFIEYQWRETDDADSEQPVVHPVMDLLLRRWLARKPELWNETHHSYVVAYAAPNDEPLRYHHMLAQVVQGAPADLDKVIGYLDTQFTARPLPEWLRVLDTVVSAPNRIRTARSPREVVTRLVGAAEPANRRQVIARLAVARWLYRDRTFDATHKLAKVIAAEYENLAEKDESDGDMLFDAAVHYYRIQKWWSDRS